MINRPADTPGSSRSLVGSAALTRALVVGAVLAGSVGVRWPASASSAAPTRPADTCRSVAAKHHYVHGDSASQTGNVTDVAAHLARIHCGGPDDVSYNVTHKRVHLTLSPDTVVRVLATPGGIETRRIAPSRLPTWLSRDHNSRIFQVTGPRAHVTRLVELFHP